MMGGKTVVWCLFMFVHYFVTAVDTLIEDGSEVVNKNWYNWYKVASSEANTICGTTNNEYRYFKKTRSCYRVHRQIATWDDAEATCLREGGHLAVINSRAEARFFMRHFPVDASQVFLGFYKKEGSWVTVQRQSLTESGYNLWHNGEPNNKTGKENCGAMYRDGTLNDMPCDYKTGFICEKGNSSQRDAVTEAHNNFNSKESDHDFIKEKASRSGIWCDTTSEVAHNICGTTDKGYSYQKSTQSCYKFHEEQATWDDAEATCVREGGHLAVINSQDEADFFIRHFRRRWSIFYLGFHIVDGSWVTIDGQTLSKAGYENWGYGRPSHAIRAKNCGVIYYDGTLSDIPCYLSTPFICKKKPNPQDLVTTAEDEETNKPTENVATTVQQGTSSTGRSELSVTTPVQQETSSTGRSELSVTTPVQQETSSTGRSEPFSSTEFNSYTECDAIYEDYKFDSLTRSCYKLHKETASRDVAEAICKREHATLVKIDTLPEVGIVTKLPGAEIVYVGQLRGSWPLAYGIVRLNRAARAPEDVRRYIVKENRFWETNDSGDLPCIAMYSGIFSSVSCKNEFAFICEKTDLIGHYYLEPVAVASTEAQPKETTETDDISEEQYSTEKIPTSVGFHNECDPSDTEYRFLESTKSCYKVHTMKATWNEAETTCVQEGGHLAVINSKDEADYFMANFPLYSYQIFLGFYLKDGSWVTTQGQTLAETGYENWNDGEPNNVTGDQNCGSMYPEGTFDDIGCNSELSYICEMNAILKPDTEEEDIEGQYGISSYFDGYSPEIEEYNTESNRECNTTVTGYLYYDITQSCYKVHTERATWNDAETTCVREGGHLAVINSQDEADVLTTLYPKDAEHVFVGFSYYQDPWGWNTNKMYNRRRLGAISEWRTIDGKTLSGAGYENWSPGEPNNAGGREYCGTMYGNGKFDDSSCNNLFDFICEIKPLL